MEVWVDPETKRIKAIYVDCSTSSTVWKDRGYEKYEAVTSDMLPMISIESESRDNSKLEDLLISKGVLTQKDVEGLK